MSRNFSAGTVHVRFIPLQYLCSYLYWNRQHFESFRQKIEWTNKYLSIHKWAQMDRIGCVALCCVLWEKENAIKKGNILNGHLWKTYLCRFDILLPTSNHMPTATICCCTDFFSFVLSSRSWKHLSHSVEPIFFVMCFYGSHSRRAIDIIVLRFFLCRNSPFCHMSSFMAIRTVRMKTSETHTTIRF